MSVDIADDKFPRNMLEGTKEERLQYFKDYIVEHSSLERAVDEVVDQILKIRSEGIVVVCGPTGVGKKQLIKRVEARLIELAKPKLEINRGCIPIVSVEADSPDVRNFEFPRLWEKSLEELREPMVDKKITYIDEVVVNELGERVILSRTKKGNLRDVLIKTLDYRQTSALIINEAQHILRQASGKKVNWAIDVIKSLANKSPTPFVLVGTYALTAFLEDLERSFTDQLIRRAEVVEFPRYKNDIEDDVRKFAETVVRLLRNMPFKKSPVGLAKSEIAYFYKYSLGCVGTLKEWFDRAYHLALSEDAETLTKEHLDLTRLSGRRCESILLGIREGEEKLALILSEGSLDESLGITQKEKRTEEIIIENRKVTQRRSRPFTRNPKRDVVGLEQVTTTNSA